MKIKFTKDLGSIKAGDIKTFRPKVGKEIISKGLGEEIRDKSTQAPQNKAVEPPQTKKAPKAKSK